ncbi:MAG TPA: hypothetical protein VN397_02040 [Candidatus Methylomirabilis sp.]|nr:hypothetical protein [Candidatus Methylomirabilis sp.]
MRSFPILAVGLILVGAGCSLPKPPPVTAVPGQRAVTVDLDKQRQPDMPCISFRHRQGFEQWLNAYEKGDDDLAVNLAINAKLPKKPPSKLIQDLRMSLNKGDFPEYLCALDDAGDSVAWVADATGASLTECVTRTYVSVGGKGVISEIKTLRLRSGQAPGRPASCTQLCKPRVQSPETFLWQCDFRTEDKRVTWVEAYMDRKTGETRLGDCWKDDLGMLMGCTAP